MGVCMYIYIYIYVYAYVCTYVYMYMCIGRDAGCQERRLRAEVRLRGAEWQACSQEDF